MSKPSLILASTSQNRIDQLKSLAIPFEHIAPTCDEAALKLKFKHLNVYALAKQLAQEKAQSVTAPSNAIILAADQICAYDTLYFDKPLTHENAFEQLKTLQGQTHEIITALCLVQNQTVLWEHIEITQLKMRPLSDDEIHLYLRLEKPYQSCGAYHYETLGKWLFESVCGLESNIIGLPMPVITEVFYKHGLFALSKDLLTSIKE